MPLHLSKKHTTNEEVQIENSRQNASKKTDSSGSSVCGVGGVVCELFEKNFLTELYFLTEIIFGVYVFFANFAVSNRGKSLWRCEITYVIEKRLER